MLMGGSLLLLEPAAIQAQHNIDLASFEDGATTEGFVIYGADVSGYSGHSVSAAGDVNGDGHSDFFVSAWFEDGELDETVNSGVSYIIFGGSPTFTNIDLNSFDSNGTSDGIVILGAQGGDLSGSSLSGLGDFNGDGLADLLIGASGTDGFENERQLAGGAYVVFGKSLEFRSIDLADFDSEANSSGIPIFGAGIEDRLGRNGSGIGDFNGDGYADLLMSTSSADGPLDARFRGGDSYLIFGKSSDLSYIDLATFDAGANSNGFTLWGARERDYSGANISGAGDVNGDGFADILIGAPGAQGRYDAQNRAGDTYLIFGKPDGLTNFDLSNLNTFARPEGLVVWGAEAGDLCGLLVSSAGDLNGDGFTDMLIHSFVYSPSEEEKVSGMYVIFGKSSGFNNLDLINFNSDDKNDGFIILGSKEKNISASSASSAGDFNGDGFMDILLGAAYAGGSSSERSRAGVSYIIYGKSSGFRNIELASFEHGATDDGFAIFGIDAFDRSGSSISGAGDINSDGFDDILIGAWAGDGPLNERYNAGESYVIFGRETAPILNYTDAPSSATYRLWARAGEYTHPVGVGVTGDGSDFDSPASRVKIGFFGELDSGGPGLNGASLQEVTLYRNKDLIQNVGVNPGAIANVSWRVTTNRERYTNVWMKLIWTAAEVSGLNRDALVVYEAPTPNGPWILAPTQTNEPNRRRVVIDTLPFDNGTKYFIIVDSSFDARAMANEVIDCLLGQAPPAPHHDANRDGMVNISDVVTLLE
jgi:hypothetical protein